MFVSTGVCIQCGLGGEATTLTYVRELAHVGDHLVPRARCVEQLQHSLAESPGVAVQTVFQGRIRRPMHTFLRSLLPPEDVDGGAHGLI